MRYETESWIWRVVEAARLRARMQCGSSAMGVPSPSYRRNMHSDSMAALSLPLPERRQASVLKEIIQASGRPDEGVMRLAGQLGQAGRRLLLVSLAVAVYDVVEADDKPREVMRQGVLAGAGLVGGWAAGSAAVAVGVCAATAPVCVGVIAFVGGLLATYGTDASFGSLYPRPTR